MIFDSQYLWKADTNNMDCSAATEYRLLNGAYVRYNSYLDLDSSSFYHISETTHTYYVKLASTIGDVKFCLPL